MCMIVIDFYVTDTRPLSHSPGHHHHPGTDQSHYHPPQRGKWWESASGYYNIDESFPVHQQFVSGWRGVGGGGKQYRNCCSHSFAESVSHTLVRIYLLNNCVVASQQLKRGHWAMTMLRENKSRKFKTIPLTGHHHCTTDWCDSCILAISLALVCEKVVCNGGAG